MSKLRFTVEVTEETIEQARIDGRNDAFQCMVAEAIRQTVPGAMRVEVDLRTIRFTLDEERYAYLTPYAVAGYVTAFDKGDTIKPFSFILRDPEPVRRRKRTAAGRATQREYNAKQRGDEVKAAKASKTGKQSETTNKARKAPPRGFRRGREFGMRALPANRDDQAA